MTKRTGKPRGRPPNTDSDIELVLFVRRYLRLRKGRLKLPKGRLNIEAACGEYLARYPHVAEARSDDPVGSLVRRYSRVATAYPDDAVRYSGKGISASRGRAVMWKHPSVATAKATWRKRRKPTK